MGNVGMFASRPTADIANQPSVGSLGRAGELERRTPTSCVQFCERALGQTAGHCSADCLSGTSAKRPLATCLLLVYQFHGCPYIRFLAVHEDHRRKGIASALVEHIERLDPGERHFL